MNFLFSDSFQYYRDLSYCTSQLLGVKKKGSLQYTHASRKNILKQISKKT